jgi:hypothetical protein
MISAPPKRDFQPAAQLLKHRPDARKLLVSRCARRTGSSRFTANVQQIRAGFFHFERVLHGALRRDELAPVGETVWRNIEYTHHQGASAELQRSRAQLQFEASSLNHE